MPKHKIRLSTSAISRYKACPTRFKFSDVEGIRLDESPDALRIGTNYHEMQEVYRANLDAGDHDTAFELVLEHLNNSYADTPVSKTAEEWAVEREMLVALFLGHINYWADDELETVATEINFELPLHHPATGMPLSLEEVYRLGKIDRVVIRNGKLMVNEYKTTGSSVDPASQYWDRLKIDTQVSMYDLALRDGIAGGVFDMEFPDLPIGGCLYDVTRKPTISPKKLTQGDSHKFINAQEWDGKYEGVQFAVEYDPSWDKEGNFIETLITVDGWKAEVTPGAKEGSFAIHETPGMYRARLMQDIAERPEFYYARREVPRTEKDRANFRQELYAVYRQMRYSIESGHFFHNESHCDEYGGCDYRPICLHGVKVEKGKAPPGFRRIFTDLTIAGKLA